jgi:hypothetical protein
MKPSSHSSHGRCGAALIEALIAIGVLALAIPPLFSALAEAGKCQLETQAESTSTWMVAACMNEIHASRDGCPQYFTPTTVGQTFPPDGGIWALAFSLDGQPIGVLSQRSYENGVRDLNGRRVRYVAFLDSSMVPTKAGLPAMVRIHISLEYPAILSATQRRKVNYYTHIP